MTDSGCLRRAIRPLSVFAGVMATHLAWVALVAEPCLASTGCQGTCCPGGASGWDDYLRSGGYWTGYTYALAAAFAVVAFRDFRERRLRSAGTALVGGVTLSGFLAVAGCFLVGCCGSPMLGVYLSLFGAGFIPFAKPLVAGITTILIAFFYFRMKRSSRTSMAAGASCPDTACGCGPGTLVAASSPSALPELAAQAAAGANRVAHKPSSAVR